MFNVVVLFMRCDILLSDSVFFFSVDIFLLKVSYSTPHCYVKLAIYNNILLYQDEY